MAETDEARADGRRRVAVTVTGVVQAVGFRPFVYREATARDLAGAVQNLGDAGVAIDLEGDAAAIDDFLATLRSDAPPLARVDAVTVEPCEPVGADSFAIEPSADADRGSGSIPPDTGICDACLGDVRDPDSRYHDYWATACVDCGPRFTVVRELPYDRERTAMDAYPLCDACRAAYEDPADRRYHAQTTACPDCGPTVRLVTPEGDELASGPAAIERAMARVADGALVGIKGTGGTHVACEATDPRAVHRLRQRFDRPAKPFALMAPDVASVERFAHLDGRERDVLTDVRRPITTLVRRDRSWLDAVAPGLHTVGVMLPYAGLHHLLFDARGGHDPLVLTSANLPGVPMATTTEGLLDVPGLDAALVHDREIVARCDDSVARVVDGQRTFLRRSRGWVPRRVPAPVDGPTVLAMGGEFDATVAVSRGGDVVPSQHVGDVDGPDSLEAHRAATDHLLDLFGVEPAVLAADLHPEFLTTAEADRRGEDPVRVQHHHAHAAALLGEHGRERGVVVTLDGTGYGPDGTVWGGEVLDAGLADYERVGGLAPFGLPGGEQAVRYPARILATLLEPARAEWLLAHRRVGANDPAAPEQVYRQAERGVNCPTTTSAGRYLDAVAALLDVCTERHYEGQPAMQLEAAAARGDPIPVAVPFTDCDGRRCVDTPALVCHLADLAETRPAPDVAATAQAALADGLAELAVEAGGDDPIGVSGGVALNDAVVSRLRERVEGAGREWLVHDRLPPGDGGLAYGQAVVAMARA